MLDWQRPQTVPASQRAPMASMVSAPSAMISTMVPLLTVLQKQIHIADPEAYEPPRVRAVP